MAMRRISPILPPLMVMMSDNLTSQLEVARIRVVMFSALQGFLGLVAIGWSFIGQLLDANYYPFQTVFPMPTNGTTATMAPVVPGPSMAFTVFYDTAATGAAMLLCCVIGLLFCSRTSSKHGAQKHDGSSDLGCLPLYVAICVASVTGTFYLLHQNMLPYSVAHPWEGIPGGSTKLVVYYAVRLAIGAAGVLINVAAIDAALRQLHLLSQVTFNTRITELYETFVRGGVIAATVETARNSISTLNAPDYAAATRFSGVSAAAGGESRHRLERMSSQVQQHHNHDPARVITGSHQVVELAEHNLNGSVNGGLEGSESEEMGNVMALVATNTGTEASAPRSETPQAEYVATRKSHALHVANARGSVDMYESQSGAAAIINATRRSTQEGRLSE